MEALLDLREGLGTHLADKRERSKRKDRPICDEIRVASEVLWQGNGCHIREMAAESWHAGGESGTAVNKHRLFHMHSMKKRSGVAAYHSLKSPLCSCVYRIAATFMRRN